MSIYLNTDEYVLFKIININLLYYDDFKDENDYYIKIYQSISSWFSHNLLVSNRIQNLDECLKNEVLSKINEYGKMNYNKKNLFETIEYKQINYNKELFFDTNISFYSNYELLIIKNYEDFILKNIDKYPLYICYLTKKIDCIFIDIIIQKLIDKYVINDTFVKIIDIFMYNPDFISYKEIICSDKNYMTKLINKNNKYIKLLHNKLKFDINFMYTILTKINDQNIQEYIDEDVAAFIIDKTPEIDRCISVMYRLFGRYDNIKPYNLRILNRLLSSNPSEYLGFKMKINKINNLDYLWFFFEDYIKKFNNKKYINEYINEYISNDNYENIKNLDTILTFLYNLKQIIPKITRHSNKEIIIFNDNYEYIIEYIEHIRRMIM